MTEIATAKEDPLVCQLATCEAPTAALREVEGEWPDSEPAVFEVRCAQGHTVQVMVTDAEGRLSAMWTTIAEEGIFPTE